PRGPCPLAHGPPRDVFATGITGRFAEPFLLLFFRTEPGKRHQREAVDEQHRGESGIDGGDLFSHDLEIHIADPAAAISLRQKARGESELVTLDVGALEE